MNRWDGFFDSIVMKRGKENMNHLTYDKVENIAMAYDDLHMTYEGNMLTSVRDNASRLPYSGATDFDGMPGENPLTYNGSGSLVSDAGHGIARIDYDRLNNPVRIQFTDGSVTRYIYSAASEKLRVIHQTAVPNISVAIGSTRELAPSEVLSADSTDYLLGGSLTLRNGRIDKLQFEEGYCQASAYGGNATQDDFSFHYYDRDHLGNIRQVVRADRTTNGTLVQTMDYYPFGAQFCDRVTDSNVQSRRYNFSIEREKRKLACSSEREKNRPKVNGKELDKMHGLDTYDYGARQYDPVLGRWDRMDPLCEKYYGMSPYAYCANNPINAFDPDGKLIVFEKDASLMFKLSFLITVSILKKIDCDKEYNILMNAPEIYTIHESSEVSNWFDPVSLKIGWNPNMGLATNLGNFLSPLTRLNHEFAHAVHFHENQEQFFEMKKGYSPDNPDYDYSNPEDKEVINNTERKTAAAMGEIEKDEYTREDHGGRSIRVAFPFSNKSLEPVDNF